MLAEPVILIAPIIVRPMIRLVVQNYTIEPETTQRHCAIVNFDWPQAVASGHGALVLQKTHENTVWSANRGSPPTSSDDTTRPC